MDNRDGQFRVVWPGGARAQSPPGNEGWSGGRVSLPDYRGPDHRGRDNRGMPVLAQPVLRRRDQVVPDSPIGMGELTIGGPPQCPELGDLGG